MAPFVSDLTLGTDYINYHVYHQLDLLFSVKSGSFPLYAPACYYGQSSVYPHAQLYHPMGYLAALMPGFWQGYSLEWLTLFRLVTLALCHLCLFHFLKQMRLDRPMAFVISLITVYNLRMLALFWNVIALEAYTGTLFLCAAVGCYYLKPSGWRGPVMMIGAVYWLITSDFPPMVFYGFTGVAIFTLTLPFLHNTFAAVSEKADLRRIFRFWGTVALCLTAGVVLSSDYLLPFFWDYMRNSSGRVDQPYQWAVQWTDTVPGFLNNFFSPLGSGFSMFGGSPLFLTAIIAPVALVLSRKRVPPVIWVLGGIVVLVCLYMQGGRTPVHYWAWQYIPLMSALRGPGRIALILPLLLMMILTWLAGTSFQRNSIDSGKTSVRPLAVVGIAALVITLIYVCLPDHLFDNPHYGCPCNLRSIPEWVEPAIIITSLIVLGLLLVYFQTVGDRRKVSGFFLAVFTIFQLMMIFRYGPYAVAPKEKTPTYDQILEQKKAAVNFQPVFFLNQHAGSRVVVRQLRNYFMESDLAKIYRRYLTVFDIDAVYARLNGDRQPDEVIIEGFSPNQENFLKQPDCVHTPDWVRLIYASHNRLIFSVQACQSAFFVLSYPCSGHWQAWLNGQKTVIYRANGAAHAVRIPAGGHAIEFRYWSNAAFYGMVVSCLTFALLVGLVGIRWIGGSPGCFTATVGILVAAALFGLWYGSLYAGDNLGTRYEWQSPPPDAPVNLAFGKPTQMSSHQQGYPWLYNSRHAVDGGRGVDSCCFTDKEKEPWWQVDLQNLRQVEKIILYTGFAGDRFNGLPLIMSISNDGQQWRETQIGQPGPNGRMELVFETPDTLRYINIRASGECVLSLNEVEVYGPGVRSF